MHFLIKTNDYYKWKCKTNYFMTRGLSLIYFISGKRVFRVLLKKNIYLLSLTMDKPPPKKKRLIMRDDETESEPESDESDTQMNEQVNAEAPSPINQAKPETPPPAVNEPVDEPVPEPVDESDGKEKQPRLIMKKMVLNNFKSYAGRQVIGPFHKVKQNKTKSC